MLAASDTRDERTDDTRIPGPLYGQQFRGRKADTSTARGIRIVVEGNIASGKTSLLEMFAKLYKAEVLVEPVKKWQDLGGASVLGRMYQDPSRWGYLFQSYVLLTMMELHNTRLEAPLSVMERSVFSARNCFMENLYRNGVIDDMEFTCYQQWFDYLISTNKPQVDLIVYLRTSPEICLQRLKHRGRQEENTVSLKYLKSLHDRHEQWLSSTKWAKQHDIPVLVLDGDTDFQTDSSIHQKLSKKIIQELSHKGIQ